jgi:hypothetical protein
MSGYLPAGASQDAMDRLLNDEDSDIWNGTASPDAGSRQAPMMQTKQNTNQSLNLHENRSSPQNRHQSFLNPPQERDDEEKS